MKYEQTIFRVLALVIMAYASYQLSVIADDGISVYVGNTVTTQQD